LITEVLHRVASHPLVYDAIQRMAGCRTVLDRLSPHLQVEPGESILDVGAGTGLLSGVTPSAARYIWLDCDLDKLRGFRAKGIGALAVIGDAVQTCMADKSVDYAACVAVSHHIPDERLDQLFCELSRMVRRRLIFLDAVRSGGFVSNLLWKYDRGGFPRADEVLCEHVSRYFEIMKIERFTVYHQYLLLIAKPRERAVL
jgi:SAM-dependent methyltransferase